MDVKEITPKLDADYNFLYKLLVHDAAQNGIQPDKDLQLLLENLTIPYPHEGDKKHQLAQEYIERLEWLVDNDL